MGYELLEIARQVRERRAYQNLSQRDLSTLSGVPQAQISRIEAGKIDLRLSSLIALASALGLELILVPRQATPAVRAVVGALSGTSEGDEPRPAYTLDEEDDDD